MLCAILNAMLSILTVLVLAMALAFPTIMITITYPFSKKCALYWSNYITKHSSRVFFAILKVMRNFEFKGDKVSKNQLPEQFLIISNHQSLMDIVAYLAFFNEKEVRFVAKDTLNKVPMVGKMLKSQGHCMIPRRGGAGVAMRSLEKFGKQVLQKNQIPVIFPEGTRSKSGKLGQFYSAGFRRLEETVRLPVAVCALDGGWRLSDVKRIMANLKKGAYYVKVLKVYDAPLNREEEKKILEEAPILIQKQLDEWRS